MTDKKAIKPLEELNLLDGFLFDVVLENTENYQDILAIVLGEDISLLNHAQMEKVFQYMPEVRSVRMDVVAMDDEKNIFNAEMQGKNTGNLLKRSRLYQSHLDVSLLRPGTVDFNLLNNTCLIMIMPFDIFGKGRYRYTCKTRCMEEPDIEVNDGITKIFLNTRGTNPEGVNQELIDFLHYVEHSTKENCMKIESERIHRLHDSVEQIKSRKDMGVKYMQRWEEEIYIREEGRVEGLAEGKQQTLSRLNELTKRLILDGRTDDILRGTEDLEYQEQLMKEYGL